MNTRVNQGRIGEERAFLWLGSTFIHAAVAALILARAPFGLVDRHHVKLSAAPNIELGMLPVQSPERDPDESTTTLQQSSAEPESDKAQPELTTAAIAPDLRQEQVMPPAVDELPRSEDPTEPAQKEIKPEPVGKKATAKERPVERDARRERRERKPLRQEASRSPSHLSGTMAGTPSNNAQTGAARANYGALLRAEIMRRRVYPPEAASRGDQGTVMARVTIGPGGTATSHAVVRGSGIASFDQAVPQIMARLSLLPPPGGSYTATVAIRFALD
jgi:TonB family protein